MKFVEEYLPAVQCHARKSAYILKAAFKSNLKIHRLVLFIPVFDVKIADWQLNDLR